MVSYTVVADNEFNALKKAVSYVPDAADNEIYGNLIDLEPDNLALDVGQTDYKPYCLEGSQSYYYEYTDEEIKAVGLDADDDDDDDDDDNDDYDDDDDELASARRECPSVLLFDYKTPVVQANQPNINDCRSGSA
jgi:hypothetical protein